MSKPLSPHDWRYVSAIPAIDASKIGELINQGVHHRVYKYGAKHVIKIPRRLFDFLYSTKSHLEADLELIEQYFPQLLISTHVYAAADQKQHCIVQEYITDFQAVTPATVLKVWPQFERLRAENQKLIREKKTALDFLGGEGFISCAYSLFSKSTPYFSNMLIIKGKIRLVDSELLRLSLPSFSFAELVRFVLSFNSFLITEVCLNSFFNLKRLARPVINKNF